MRRLLLALTAFWQILRRADRAAAWEALSAGGGGGKAPAPGGDARPTLEADAVYTLALLQREGRLIDFLLEDIDAYSDAQVGAAARQIHAGCQQAVTRHFAVVPLVSEEEGAPLAVPVGFDAARIRLTGRVSGQPPYRGRVVHRGWRAAKVQLPARHAQLDPSVVSPAEVEVE